MVDVEAIGTVLPILLIRIGNGMKVVRFEAPDGGGVYGCLDQEAGWVTPFPRGFKLSDLLSGIPDPPTEGRVALKDVRLLAPVDGPEKIICIGKNYADHAREMGGEPPSLPVIFNKFPTALNHPQGEVVLPAISDQVDFEAELVVVIGKGGRNIEQGSARQHVLGYCCGNDISARDWQKGKPGGQWLLGKTFDGFAPLGPWLVTSDEVDGDRLDIQLRLNGHVMQNSNTSHFIFEIDFLIAHLSKFCELKFGDLIFTGTPAGVGAGRTPPVFLSAGDVLEVEIEGLGVLENRVV